MLDENSRLLGDFDFILMVTVIRRLFLWPNILGVIAQLGFVLLSLLTVCLACTHSQKMLLTRQIIAHGVKNTLCPLLRRRIPVFQ
jgi:hypothetical protein